MIPDSYILNNNTYTAIDGKTVFDGCGISLVPNDSGDLDGVYKYQTSSLINVTEGAFPVLVINDEAKTFVSIKISNCIICQETGFGALEYKIKCMGYDGINLVRISTESYLFVHIKWLTLRFGVSSVGTYHFSDGEHSIVVTINLSDDFHNDEIFSSLLGQESIIEIVNPNIADEQITEGHYIWKMNVLRYRSTVKPTNIKIANEGTILTIYNRHHITFSGLTFRNNGVVDIRKGSEQQAEATCAPCITISKSSFITFENCEFYGIMGYCVDVVDDDGEGCSNISFKDCRVHDTFGGGFQLDNCTFGVVENCLIKNFGMVQGGAVGILLKRNANNCDIHHNTIHDGNYTGISVGWTWGYDKDQVQQSYESNCYNNKIRYNHIHHCMRMASNDGGGIYTLGESPNTVIECNIIHDILSKDSDESAAIYLDEGSSYIKCRNNICYGCDRFLHLHFGYANEIYNNLFAYCNTSAFKYSKPYNTGTGKPAIISDDKCLGFFAHENIFILDSGSFMNPTDGKGVYIFSTNLIDGGIEIEEYPDYRIRYCFRDTHQACLSHLIGISSQVSLRLTKFGVETLQTLSPTIANSMKLFYTAGKGFHMYDIIENPALCGFYIEGNTDDSAASNAANFEQQRQAVALHFTQHSNYFNI